MLNRLVIASVLALTSACTHRETVAAPALKSDVLFELAQRNKADVALPEFELALRADGSWTYVETLHQAIKKRGSGQLAADQLALVRGELARAQWKVITADVTCMAYAASFKQYSVDGVPVFREELCSGDSLDADSRAHLAKVMEIVTPLIAGMTK